MKRFCLILCMLGTVWLAGCGENEQPETETPTPVPTVTEAAAPVVSDATELKYSFLDEANEAVDGETTYFTSSVVYPVFTEGDGAEAVNAFMETLLAKFRLYLPEAEENAKYDYEEFKNGEYPGFIFPEVQEYTVSVLWQDIDVVALHVTNYSHTGGAHPCTFGMAYMINKADGTTVESEAVLAKYGLSLEEVSEYAATQLREKDGDALYEADSEETLTEWVTNFLKGNQWYLNENGLVIFANPFDIAPYAYGIIECEISYEELEQGLKKD